VKVWQLDFELDTFDNLIPVKELSLDEILSFNGISKKSEWKPIAVRKMENKELSNAPGFHSHIPVFDGTALDQVSDLILDGAEVLPMLSLDGEFYAINVTDVLDCIDYDKSVFKKFSDGKRIMRFIKYEFIADIVRGKHIFKIVDEPLRRPFVSDEFRKRVINNNLLGFKFKLVWESKD
jgi:hypothetical protein